MTEVGVWDEENRHPEEYCKARLEGRIDGSAAH
jgi:hypothetical protein